MGKNDLNTVIESLSNNFFNIEYMNSYEELFGEAFYEKKLSNKKKPITYAELLKILELDLAKLIRALEVYLADYVEKINIEDQILEIANLEPSHVLSFNYTNTYEKIYGENRKIIYNYIHGKADINATVDSSNLVLGIGEYLTQRSENKGNMFSSFKKCYQKMLKQTCDDYKLWIDDIKEEWENQAIESKRDIKRWISENSLDSSYEKAHKLYIFGHSLDITDADVLRYLILNENIQTTIYYYRKDENDKTELKKQMENMVNAIGQEELLKRTSGRNKTINFIPQSI